MGYSTDFEGGLNFSRVLTDAEVNYINAICDTRRMKRDVNKLMELYKGEHGNPFAKSNTPEDIYGADGEFFVLDDGHAGQTRDTSIIDYNTPPYTQPGLWCKWEITGGPDDGQILEWNGVEKFYHYVEWIEYLIFNFFRPWDVKLNGEIVWQGEDPSDMGKIIVVDNAVSVKTGKIVYE